MDPAQRLEDHCRSGGSCRGLTFTPARDNMTYVLCRHSLKRALVICARALGLRLPLALEGPAAYVRAEQKIGVLRETRVLALPQRFLPPSAVAVTRVAIWRILNFTLPLPPLILMALVNAALNFAFSRKPYQD